MTYNNPQVGRKRRRKAKRKATTMPTHDPVLRRYWCPLDGRHHWPHCSPNGHLKPENDGAIHIYEIEDDTEYDYIWVPEGALDERGQIRTDGAWILAGEASDPPQAEENDADWASYQDWLRRNEDAVAKIATTTTTVKPYTSGPGGWSRWTCDHYGEKPVYVTDDGLSIHAASKSGLRLDRTDVVLDLADNTKWKDPFVIGPARWAELNKHAKRAEIVRLDWEDYSAPPVGIGFWIDALDLLGKGSVTVTCMGGHGRTGTAIAALMIACGVSADEAIDWVRKEHCTLAIESKSQEEYLRELDAQYLVALQEQT